MKNKDSDQIINKLIKSGKFKLANKSLDKFKLGKFITGYIKDHNHEITNFVGGACCGKNTIVKKIEKDLSKLVIISTDDFHVGKTRTQRDKIKIGWKKVDFNKLQETTKNILSLKTKQKIKIPKYDSVRGLGIHSKLKRTIIGPVKYLIIQGIYPGLKKPDLRIYFHLADKERLQNRLKRDMIERGYKNRGQIIKSFQSRQQIEHFPCTLPESEKSNILILAKRTNGKKFNFCVYLK